MLQLCVKRVKLFHLRYAGLLDGTKCVGSDGFNRGGATTGCTEPCSGAPAEECGGSNKVSVYEPLPSFWDHTPMLGETIVLVPRTTGPLGHNPPSSCFLSWFSFPFAMIRRMRPEFGRTNVQIV